MGKNISRLEHDLTVILGEKKCLFSLEDRWTYSFDASQNQALPQAVVFPSCPEDVCAVMAHAYRNQIPVIPRGAGSGLTGGAVPVKGGIVMALDRMNKILEVDTQNLCAVVETGVVTADLQDAAARFGLFYPPDPASMHISTIGGNIAENAGGMQAAKYGVTKQYVLGLEVVLPDGRLITLGSKCIKDVVGYSLTELFIGSEGTFGIITKAIVKLVKKPETVKTITVCFSDIQDAGQVVPLLMKTGVTPCTLEFMDAPCLKAVQDMGFAEGMEQILHEKTQAVLLIEVDGSVAEVEQDAKIVLETCEAAGMLKYTMTGDMKEREKLWLLRRSIHGALMGLCSQWMEEDISVPPAAIPKMLEKLQALSLDENLRIICFGHYADGNIHLSVSEADAPLSPERAEMAKIKIFTETIKLGGRIAAEHGIGLDKKEYLGLNMDTATLDFALEIKKMIDPKGILNPGKIFPEKLWNKAYHKGE